MLDTTFGRIRISNSAWLPPFEKNWLFVWGGDECGNRVFEVRISPSRYFGLVVTPRIRHRHLPCSVIVNKETDQVLVEYKFGEPVDESILIGHSLWARYDKSGHIVSLILPRPDALSNFRNMIDLQRELPSYVISATVRDVQDTMRRIRLKESLSRGVSDAAEGRIKRMDWVTDDD